MNTADFFLAIKAMEAIEAQELLINMQLADYPNMKKEDRSKFHRRVVKKSDPFVKERIINNDDIMSMFDSNSIEAALRKK